MGFERLVYGQNIFSEAWTHSSYVYTNMESEKKEKKETSNNPWSLVKDIFKFECIVDF